MTIDYQNEDFLGDHISFIDSFYIKIHNSESDLFNITDEFRARNNIECLMLFSNWLLESHEAASADHHMLASHDDSDLEGLKSISIKLNLIICMMGRGNFKSKNLKLKNGRMNAKGMVIDRGRPQNDGEVLLEIYFSDTFPKPVLIKGGLHNIADNLHGIKFENHPSMVKDSIDKIVFLMHRNMIAANKAV